MARAIEPSPPVIDRATAELADKHDTLLGRVREIQEAAKGDHESELVRRKAFEIQLDKKNDALGRAQAEFGKAGAARRLIYLAVDPEIRLAEEGARQAGRAHENKVREAESAVRQAQDALRNKMKGNPHLPTLEREIYEENVVKAELVLVEIQAEGLKVATKVELAAKALAEAMGAVIRAALTPSIQANQGKAPAGKAR